jgi:hypothetical protein
MPAPVRVVGTARTRLARDFGGNSLIWIGLLPPLIAVLVLQPLGFLSVDADYWWHLAAGRWMISHLRVPFTDPFSFTHAGQSWYAHEWLAEVILALIDRAGGYAAALLVTAVIIAAGYWLLWRTARCYGSNNAVATLLTVAAGISCVQFIAVRPQVWSFALLSLLLHELAAHDTGRRGRLWHVPLLVALWININLLALTGIGALGLYAAHRVLQAVRPGAVEQERQRARQVLLVTGACALALCANPHGPELLWWSRLYLDQSQTFYHTVQEWQPLPFGGFNLVLYALGGIAVCVSLVGMVRRRSLWPGLLALVFAVMAARAARSVPLFALAAVPACAWALAPRPARAGTPRRTVRRLPFAAITGGVTLAVVLGTLYGRGPSQFSFQPNPALGKTPYPVQAAAWIRTHLSAPRILDEYGWGGFLIEQFAPRRVVYIDGREEMYGERFFDHYLAVLAAQPGWQSTLASAGVNAVLLQPDHPLVAALAGDPNWQRIAVDSNAALFVPSSLAGR